MGPSAPLRVLIVGATGVFGRRLAEQLVHEPGIALILAGRTQQTLAMLKSNLGNRSNITVLDRDRVTPSDLRRLGVQIVVDAAGPFQNSRTALVEAAIKAGCHYADFADGRDFVSAIRRFDTTARQQNVAILSGASSTPALSHAALDRLTDGWAEIDSIRGRDLPGKSNSARAFGGARHPVLYRSAGAGNSRRRLDVRTGMGSAAPVGFPRLRPAISLALRNTGSRPNGRTLPAP